MPFTLAYQTSHHLFKLYKISIRLQFADDGPHLDTSGTDSLEWYTVDLYMNWDRRCLQSNEASKVGDTSRSGDRNKTFAPGGPVDAPT